VVETELQTLKALFADLKQDHQPRGKTATSGVGGQSIFGRRPKGDFLTDGGQRSVEVAKPFARRLNALNLAPLAATPRRFPRRRQIESVDQLIQAR
jgi:hypothetical protein